MYPARLDTLVRYEHCLSAIKPSLCYYHLLSVKSLGLRSFEFFHNGLHSENQSDYMVFH